MSRDKIELGLLGEKKAQEFLKDNGYKILDKNFRTALGEIDIVAKDKDCICFVEVKTRTSDQKGSPLEAITKNKQHKLSQMALLYLKNKNLLHKSARFDIVSVMQNLQEADKIEIIKNAFSLDNRYLY
ncbi:MAG TPA: YraN family protein [Candidatus Omnitrophota bacterium]|nr:YraN family protein [Candidatus Omnitrophota bacterium]